VSNPGSVGAVLLAAGESRRVGVQKLLLPFAASTVIGSVVAALTGAGADPIVVVAGAQADEIARALTDTGAQMVRNPDPRRGMLSSLQVGVRALPAGVGRFLVALGDQPRLRSADVTRVLDEQARAGAGIAIACYQGKRGHPVVFDAKYREGVLALDDSRTLRDLIHAHPDDIVNVECESDGVIRDIDTREDYDVERRRAEAE
jgi:CTP:molybdopterin cytidylyltransferase MocA